VLTIEECGLLEDLEDTILFIEGIGFDIISISPRTSSAPNWCASGLPAVP